MTKRAGFVKPLRRGKRGHASRQIKNVKYENVKKRVLCLWLVYKQEYPKLYAIQ